MRQRCFKASFFLLAISIATISLAQEDSLATQETVVISSGLQGGGYWNAANQLQLGAKTVALSIENQNSTGSVINIKRLLDKKNSVAMAFAQADALEHYFNQHPDARQTVEVLKDIGEECVFIIADAKSNIRSDQDMQKARQLGLGIRSPNSGIRVTFDYMRSLIPELDFISVHYGDTVDMMENFTTPLTQVKAVMVVQGPDQHSPEIDLMLTNPDRFHLVKLSDKRLTNGTAGASPVYHRLRVAPEVVVGERAVPTICVKGLLLANRDKLSNEQRAKISTLMDSHWAQDT